MCRRVAARMIAGIALGLMLLALARVPSRADDVSPFERLIGRWVGEGRLGIKGGTTETVKCRVTYLLAEDGSALRQSIRCVSQGGNVEVTSSVSHAAGRLTGTWKELTRDWSGELTGSVNDHGYKVAVKGASLSANMDIIVKGAQQVIEIQFHNSSLIGLTLILTKG
jgi:hypothetical protein